MRLTTDRRRIIDGSYHHHLLTDQARVAAYVETIEHVLEPGDVVADLGAGSGVLAATALRAGAAKVYAVEQHDVTAEALARTLEVNDLADRVEVVQADAEAWTPPEPVDVVVCEMMETGLMNEDQRAVMNAVAMWPHRPRRVIPEGARLQVALAEVDITHHGLTVPAPYLDRELPLDARILAGPAVYLAADFRVKGPTLVDAVADLAVEAEGVATAAVLLTDTVLAEDLVLPPSSDHASPLVWPLSEPLRLEEGETWRARMRYATGSVTGRVEVELARRG